MVQEHVHSGSSTKQEETTLPAKANREREGGEVTVSGIFTIIMKETNLSEIRVANAASLALILHERAEPSLLFLRARIAMILQILRTA